MYSIGTDIVKISRIEKNLQNESFLSRVFTANEIEYCKKADNFAGVFAAKEAYFKAAGTGIVFPLTDVEILHTAQGKPYISGRDNCAVSISHDGDYAVATVIIW